MSPQAIGLAKALQFHRHEVLIITSAEETVPDHLGFQVLTFFKSWSAIEALRFFPRILGQAPEVWHFVFADTETERPSAAHWVLAQLARALPGRVIAASFYDSLFNFSGRRALPLLKNCDIVTTDTRENLMFIKRNSWLGKYCETEVLPPFIGSDSVSTTSVFDQDLSQLIAASQPYLVLSSQRLPHLDWELILGKVQLLVCGQRPTKSFKGIFYLGHDLSDGQFIEILRGSQGLLTAFDDLALVELLKFQRLCALTQTPIIGSSRQAEALPGYCVHKRNGFQISSLSALHQLLLENPKLELQSPLFEPLKTDLTDSALNELNRLYAKVRHLKTSSIDFKRSPNP